MDQLFPLGFPAQSGSYLALYAATFAVHHFFMYYVVAGTLFVAWATAFPGDGAVARVDQPLASTIRDWSPFMLSAAITAGVAPLLFIQIVYPVRFYTANLLLGWRWMVVIPVLIAAFYLLYVVKAATARKWTYLLRAAAPVAAAIGFVFVGFCWTANHLISVDDARWPEIYATGNTLLDPREVALRTAIWLGAAFAGLAAIAGWQVVGRTAASDRSTVVQVAVAALGGLVLAAIAGGWYVAEFETETRGVVLGSLAGPYFVAACLGGLLQATAWCLQLMRRQLQRGLLALATLGLLMFLASGAVVREAIRLAAMDLAALFDLHAESAKIGGLSVFALFTVVNAGAIAAAVWLVRRELQKPRLESDSSAGP